MRAVLWHNENCTEFDRAFGLTRDAFRELGLRGSQGLLFKMKVMEVRRTALRIAAENEKRERE